jgi:hypothetical protein
LTKRAPQTAPTKLPVKRGIKKKVTEMSKLIAQPVTEVHLAPAPLA